MRIIANTIDEFMENSGENKESIIALNSFITKAVPSLKRKLYISDTLTTIGYCEIKYPTKNPALTNCGPILAIAPQKNMISLYAMAFKEGTSLAIKYDGKLGKTKNSKGCIRIKKFSDLDLIEFKNFLLEVESITEKTK